MLTWHFNFKKMSRIKLVTRKKKIRLSWFSRIIILLILTIVIVFSIKNLNRYLSLTKPVPSNLLVVEGFLPDYTLRNMMKEFYDGGYDQILITGKPIGQGYYLTGYNTSADLMKATLIRMGMDSNLIHKVSIPNTVSRDRTYATGLLMKQWIEKNKLQQKRVNVYTLGCHARRSKHLFQKAVGNKMEIGIIAGEDRSYDQKRWWTSSQGFRTVLNEAIAYLYVRLFFKSDNETALNELNKGYYIDEITHHRNDKDIAFTEADSPLTDEQRETFVWLNYYPPNPRFKVKALFLKDSVQTEFEMQTSTDRLPVYRNYGKLYFYIDSVRCVLTAYQNVALTEKEEYKDYLFIPYRDLTTGKETYGAGRYLDFRIPNSDSTIIDFNLAYNPLCAYNHKYSCPITPVENTLTVKIEAGEKIYKKH